MSVFYWISAAAFCALFLRPVQASWILAPAVTGGLAWLWRRETPASVERQAGWKKSTVTGLLLSFTLGVLFLVIWLRTKRLISLQFFDVHAALPYLLSAGICVPLSAYFSGLCVERLFNSCLSSADHNRTVLQQDAVEVTRVSRKDGMLLLLIAAASVTICSMSSPLYPLNDWVDANCFFTVGKSMLFGKVPYRDLYEQKGPALYMLYALSYPISHRSFFGVWLMEILAAWVFLLYARRTILLLSGSECWTPVLLTAALVYTVPSFLKGGSAEEFCLPCLMYAFYTGADCIVRNRELTLRECLVIGLTAGFVFWVKYSMVGFYLGFILVPAYRMLRDRRGTALFGRLGVIAAGVLLLSVPILFYFGYHHALQDLWQAYFFNNINVYSKSGTVSRVLRALGSGAASMLTFNDATLLLTAAALIVLARERRKVLFFHELLSFAFAFLLVYVGGINMKYYSEILCVFIPSGIALLWRRTGADEGSFGRGDGRRGSFRIRTAVLAAVFLATLFGTENRYLLRYRRQDMPQYRFAETIVSVPDATLFNYGALDIGQYTVSGIVPSCRYFCMFNLPSDEMFSEMDRYMAEGETDFIVSRGLPVESPYYRLVAETEFPDEGVLYTYYLYQHT